LTKLEETHTHTHIVIMVMFLPVILTFALYGKVLFILQCWITEKRK